MILSINEMDLMNMLRHAYLFGINEGVDATRKDPKRPDLYFNLDNQR